MSLVSLMYQQSLKLITKKAILNFFFQYVMSFVVIFVYSIYNTLYIFYNTT